MSDEFRTNLLGPDATLLPEETDLLARFAAGDEAVDLAAAFPASSLPWAILADEAFSEGNTIESYAYARTGYHRGLDALRRNGWRGVGPVPWSHEPNRGFLRALYALGRDARAIGEAEEAERITVFLNDSDPKAIAALEG
ncbi:hypothetical cytosolic protein [Renibacterium salmoninarum ATCC 33209]|uniref:Hypothetical cytosolic protein n=1 Tax=Renibacterium salmoninarum (strain ATCC 33209 / DSM 20767 / JCM 11484 / NBRC 15589 / NCIMB 2235) TaxID=288705 RepID=A9WV82_RENSM|nr:DUF3151 domain-containing protein [Renibacterium salmoninarum]ABY25103.1 hypothetical cytosolic protein [Renibacterium salmoninarum ATCC 33209]